MDRTTVDGIGKLAHSIPKAAELLDMQERYVWELVRREDREPGTGIPSFKVGGLRRIRHADLTAWVDKQFASSQRDTAAAS